MNKLTTQMDTDLKKICDDFWEEILRDSPRFGVYRGFDKYPKLDRYDRERYEERKVCI